MLFELLGLYLGFFFLSWFFSYVAHGSASSYVLIRYLKPLLEYQTQLLLGLSLVVAVHHYQFLLAAKTEVKCRVLVGDRVCTIRFRYALACVTILLFSFCISIAAHLSLNLNIDNSVYLFTCFAAYITLTALLLR